MKKFKDFEYKHKLLLFSLLFLILGGVFGYLIGLKKYRSMPAAASSSDVFAINQQNSDYKLINPLLAYDENKEFYEFNPMQDKVQSLIQKFKDEGKVDNVGFYFRERGHWSGINQDDKFYPASLMKVPLMIAYFKLAEIKPEMLKTKYKYDGKEDLNAFETRKPGQAIQPGQSYSVLELIRYMIVYSDNNATYILQNNIDQNSFHEIYTDLGVPVPDSNGTGASDYFSPKQYSLFLRILRNATYLTQEYSEQAMEFLSQVDFKNGLVAAVPNGITVAHKFGENVSPNADGSYSYQLHDCGFIFNPQRPYLLCLMTRAKSPNALEDVIKQISGLVYQEVSNNYK